MRRNAYDAEDGAVIVVSRLSGRQVRLSRDEAVAHTRALTQLDWREDLAEALAAISLAFPNDAADFGRLARGEG
jgi:hypothetical protein